MWSFIANNGTGEIAFPDGTARPIAYHNLLNLGSLTWPILKINTALQDQTTTLIDMGVVQFRSGQAREIQIQQNLQSDPTGLFSKLTKSNFFFDPSTLALLEVQDFEHPDNNANGGAMIHTTDFANYQTVNGLSVPFSVIEAISGQQTWQIQLTSVVLNTGLTDSD
jgi:hypothetical protein